MAFKDIVVTTALAAFHVLILVASKDLGAALIIFVVYPGYAVCGNQTALICIGRTRSRK